MSKKIFRKNYLSFEKKSQIWNVLRILPIQSHSLANLLPLAIFKIWRVFLEDTSKFNKKPKFLTLNVLRILALPVAFSGKFAGSSNFSKRQIFFENTIYVLKEKRKFRTFWEILQIQSHSKANLQPLAFFKKSMFFSEEPNYFSKKNPKFENFEKSYFSSRLLQQICFL